MSIGSFKNYVLMNSKITTKIFKVYWCLNAYKKYIFQTKLIAIYSIKKFRNIAFHVGPYESVLLNCKPMQFACQNIILFILAHRNLVSLIFRDYNITTIFRIILPIKFNVKNHWKKFSERLIIINFRSLLPQPSLKN